MAGAWYLMAVYDLLAAKPEADRDWFAGFVDDVVSPSQSSWSLYSPRSTS
jgi:hypothetical protein